MKLQPIIQSPLLKSLTLLLPVIAWAGAEDLVFRSSFEEGEFLIPQPLVLAATPNGPANNNEPEITGTAFAGTMIELFSDAGCSTKIATGTETQFSGTGIMVSVADDSATNIYARASDALNNISQCSSSFVTYIEDSTAPDPPVVLGSSPTSPANDNNPEIFGTAEADSTVRLFSDLACSVQIASGSAELFGGSGVTSQLEAPVSPKAVSRRYIVVFKQGRAQQGRMDVLAAGGTIALALTRHNALAVELPGKSVFALRNNPNIDYLEIDPKRFPSSLNTAQTAPYGINQVQADSLVFQGGIKVCIIDSGYDGSHPDLRHNINITGSSTGNAGPWDEDGSGHGTHVSGTIAAIDNGIGVVGVLGGDGQTPADTLQIHMARVFDANGDFTYASGLIGALDDCVDNGAVVINMSLGGGFQSKAEESAFNAVEQTVLSIAAAGNDGNKRHSYPASYDSVISVAAVDEFEAHADFSQATNQVELAAPGVHVLSTVPVGTGDEASALVDAVEYIGDKMAGSVSGVVSGTLIDCGLGDSVCDTTAVGDDNAICLIQRGDITFEEKVQACEDGGGDAAIIYNNVAGFILGTLSSPTATTIPAIGVSDTDGAAMLGGNNATVTIETSDYAFFDGTSMATPHVAGVAGLLWSNAPECTAPEIRQLLVSSAKDLEATGRDNETGYGLVQAKNALTEYEASGCLASIHDGITITVEDNTSTDVYANATDEAGNISSCSSTFVTYSEES
jgi:serine protease